MSEETPATAEPTTEPTDRAEPDWKAEAEKWQNMARKHEERAKKDAGAAKELEKLRAAQMSETERIAAEAKQQGLTEAQKAAAPRLVRAEMRVAAVEAGLGKEALDGFLEYADLTKFVGEDGEPDTDAIAKAVARLAPAQPAEDARRPGPRPDLSQGSSNNHMALNSDALTDALRAAVGA